MVPNATSRIHRVGALAVACLAASCAVSAPERAPGAELLACEPPWSSSGLWEAAATREDTPEAHGDGWTFAGSTYAWIARKRGVIDAGGLGIPLDDPDDSVGAFLYVEGERGRWGFIADLSLMSTEDRTSTTTGEVEVDEDTIAAELDLTYRPTEDSTLRFLVGLRLLDSSADLRFPLLPDDHSDVTQVDPVIGAQGTWPLGEGFAFRLRGDIGGFGLASDSTYQALGLFAWEFADDWMLTTGYRVLGWEFDDGHGTRSDIRLSGALLGVALRF